jgi:replicative DNA helicase
VKKTEEKAKFIAKQRNGGLGSVELAFNENFAKFENLDRIHKKDY